MASPTPVAMFPDLATFTHQLARGFKNALPGISPGRAARLSAPFIAIGLSGVPASPFPPDGFQGTRILRRGHQIHRPMFTLFNGLFLFLCYWIVCGECW